MLYINNYAYHTQYQQKDGKKTWTCASRKSRKTGCTCQVVTAYRKLGETLCRPIPEEELAARPDKYEQVGQNFFLLLTNTNRRKEGPNSPHF